MTQAKHPSGGCPVTVYEPGWFKLVDLRCGKPLVGQGLCAHHLADKRRLGGGAA